MGLGDALTGIFGGKNDYSAQAPPTLGAPGSSPWDQYRNYVEQNRAYGNQTLPQHVLNMSQSNNVNNRQNTLDNQLNNRMGQDINFGTQGSMGQQQGLIDQILAQGRGEGPNPALDQLRMTTDQNARATAGLIGSQHGNSALGLRMAAHNMAGANQQAAGQGALQAAQQQLAAQQMGGGLLGQQIGQQTQQAGMNAQNQQQYAGLLAQQLAAQRGADISQASAQGQAGLGLLGQRNQAQQNYQNMINQVYGNMNNVNAGVAAQNAQTSGTYGQAGMAGASAMFGGTGLMNGGKPPPTMMNDGGVVNPFKNHVAQKLAGDNKPSLSPELLDKIHTAFMPVMASQGGEIPGRAKVDADSEKNDIVPALLSPGEVVIPRSAMTSVDDAHAFLDKIMKQNEGPSYKEVMKQKEKYHNMAHGGEIHSCQYCNGGMI